MSEPEAWPKVEMTELERKLLDAGKGDRIPNDLALRMASVLSAPSIPPTAAGTSMGASAGGHTGLLFSKTGLWGFLSLTLLAGAGAWHAAQPAPRVDAAVRVAPASSTAPALRGGASFSTAPALRGGASLPSAQAETNTRAQSAAPAPAASTATDSTVPHAEPSAAAHVATLMNTGSVAPTARDGSEALRQEIGLLDRAREALQRGAPRRAWNLLDQHQRRFAHGTLVPEAEAMRIETLVRLGAGERAQRMSRRFEEEYPAHPLRERVSAVAASQPVPQGVP